MKAILVVDIPDKHNIEELRADIQVNSYGEEILDWRNQTLIPMPKKINVENIKDTIRTEFQTPGAIYDTFRAKIQFDTDKLIAFGYNSCLDEILGGKEQ